MECEILTFKKKDEYYEDVKWWNEHFYTEGVSDRQTISAKKSAITSQYHYASIEMQILKHLRNNSISMNQPTVLDLGSGSGHWINFYNSLEPSTITGIDISASSCHFLRNKYSENASIEIIQGKALEAISKLNRNYTLVNAIGVMFHIVDDTEWQDTIFSAANILESGGLFIVGGHFGYLDGLNVQIDKGGINKRLRSKRRWIQTLKKAGFTNIKVYRNNAYLWINDTLPENNILIATK